MGAFGPGRVAPAPIRAGGPAVERRQNGWQVNLWPGSDVH